VIRPKLEKLVLNQIEYQTLEEIHPTEEPPLISESPGVSSLLSVSSPEIPVEFPGYEVIILSQFSNPKNAIYKEIEGLIKEKIPYSTPHIQPNLEVGDFDILVFHWRLSTTRYFENFEEKFLLVKQLWEKNKGLSPKLFVSIDSLDRFCFLLNVGPDEKDIPFQSLLDSFSKVIDRQKIIFSNKITNVPETWAFKVSPPIKIWRCKNNEPIPKGLESCDRGSIFGRVYKSHHRIHIFVGGDLQDEGVRRIREGFQKHHLPNSQVFHWDQLNEEQKEKLTSFLKGFKQ